MTDFVPLKEARGVHQHNHSSGIYAIRYIPTGKIYVGSSVYLKNRLRQHINSLQKNCHKNPILQAYFNKYGIDAFEYGIVEFIEEKDDLVRKEQEWIAKLEALDTQNGFNVNRIAGSRLGMRHSEATKERLRQHFTGRKLSPEHAQRSREVLRSAKVSQESRDRVGALRKRQLSRPGVATSPDGEVMYVEILSDFCKAYGLEVGSMRRVATGKAMQYRGWRFERFDSLLPADHWEVPNIWRITFLHTGEVFECMSLMKFAAEHDLNYFSLYDSWRCDKPLYGLLRVEKLHTCRKNLPDVNKK